MAGPQAADQRHQAPAPNGACFLEEGESKKRRWASRLTRRLILSLWKFRFDVTPENFIFFRLLVNSGFSY
jgi:hypothetical protein